jgi:hypothetical protein
VPGGSDEGDAPFLVLKVSPGHVSIPNFRANSRTSSSDGGPSNACSSVNRAPIAWKPHKCILRPPRERKKIANYFSGTLYRCSPPREVPALQLVRRIEGDVQLSFEGEDVEQPVHEEKVMAISPRRSLTSRRVREISVMHDLVASLHHRVEPGIQELEGFGVEPHLP